MSWKGIEKVFERGLKNIYELTGVRGGAKIGQAESLKVLKHQIAQANWERQVLRLGHGRWQTMEMERQVMEASLLDHLWALDFIL